MCPVEKEVCERREFLASMAEVGGGERGLREEVDGEIAHKLREMRGLVHQ